MGCYDTTKQWLRQAGWSDGIGLVFVASTITGLATTITTSPATNARTHAPPVERSYTHIYIYIYSRLGERRLGSAASQLATRPISRDWRTWLGAALRAREKRPSLLTVQREAAVRP